MFNNKPTLITGGCGSFGNQFVQAILGKYEFKLGIVCSCEHLKKH